MPSCPGALLPEPEVIRGWESGGRFARGEIDVGQAAATPDAAATIRAVELAGQAASQARCRCTRGEPSWSARPDPGASSLPWQFLLEMPYVRSAASPSVDSDGLIRAAGWISSSVLAGRRISASGNVFPPPRRARRAGAHTSAPAAAVLSRRIPRPSCPDCLRLCPPVNQRSGNRLPDGHSKGAHVPADASASWRPKLAQDALRSGAWPCRPEVTSGSAIATLVKPSAISLTTSSSRSG